MKPLCIPRLLALAALVFGILGCTDYGKVKVAFDERLPDSDDVATLIDQEKEDLSGFVPAGMAQKFVAAFVRLNSATVYRDVNPLELEKSMRALEIVAGRIYREDGEEAVRKLCYWLLRRFENDLDQLRKAIRQTTDGALAALEGLPAPEAIQDTYKKFVEVGGDFLRHASRAGLVIRDQKGGIELTRGARFFMRLAFKIRFSNIFPQETKPLDWLLTDFEQKWYLIWVVERSQTAPLQRQLLSISRLKKIVADYPHLTARGIVNYKHQKYKEALEAFEAALKAHPRDDRLKALVSKAKRQATR
ncbi:MAG: tetratricopeptide repeat protein [Deltaproteobacteria bacterium]|nr:tetratricopeptide repeat protein [Deltaproteobacteria bacterium]